MTVRGAGMTVRGAGMTVRGADMALLFVIPAMDWPVSSDMDVITRVAAGDTLLSALICVICGLNQ